MVEEDLERDEDDEYLSDMVTKLFHSCNYYRLIKVKANLLRALGMRNILRSRKRGRKTSCKHIYNRDNVIYL
jgi:hypothetical protein